MRLNRFFLKNLFSRYIRLMLHLFLLIKQKKITINVKYLSFLQYKIILILLLRGFSCVAKKDRKLFRRMISMRPHSETSFLQDRFFNKR